MKVGNYEFALKNVKHFESGSEETECFVAALYVNGKKLADCDNDGHGGPTNVRFSLETGKLGKEIEDFLKKQPKIKPDGYDFELQLDLEYIVDDLLEKYLNAKFIDKLRKKTATKLVFKQSETQYSHIGWGKHTIEEMLKTESGRKTIKATIARESAKGYKLINENIPEELLPAKK